MRLVVFDTNVIVSAGIRPDGAPAKLVLEWALEGLVQLVTSPAIAREYRDVTQRARFKRYDFPPLWLEFLLQESMRLPDPPAWPHPGPDPDDLPFLALAHTAGAWLITGNHKHFPKPIRQGVNVLSPAEYLVHLSQERSR